MSDTTSTNVDPGMGHLSSTVEVPVVVHPQYDQKLLTLPFDQVVPFGGEARTINIMSGTSDIGNCTMRFVTNGVLCTVEYNVVSFPTTAGVSWEFPLPALIEHDQTLSAGTWDADTDHARVGWAVLSTSTQRVSTVYMHDITSGNPRVRVGYPQGWASGDWLRIWGTYLCRSVVST